MFLLVAGPIIYILSYLPPFSSWAFEVQAYVDVAWGTIADVLNFAEIIPQISLVAILAMFLFLVSCTLLVKSWVKSRQIRYRLTSEHLIVLNGFLKRIQQQLPIKTVKDMKLEQSLFDRLVGVGTIAITTSDPKFRELSIKGVPSPEHVFNIFYHVWHDGSLKPTTTHVK